MLSITSVHNTAPLGAKQRPGGVGGGGGGGRGRALSIVDLKKGVVAIQWEVDVLHTLSYHSFRRHVFSRRSDIVG